MKTLIRLIVDANAASAVEYALMLAVLGAGIAIAANQLGSAIGNATAQSATDIKMCGGTC
jgi:pilus assembly protein Flp/PilA